MAVISITTKNTRVEDAEGAYGGANIGAGQGGGTEPDFFYEGIQCWPRKVTNAAARGFSVDIGTGIDMTEPSSSVVILKGLVANFPSVNSNAYQFFIASGTGVDNGHRYIYADDATLVDEVGGTSPIYV